MSQPNNESKLLYFSNLPASTNDIHIKNFLNQYGFEAEYIEFKNSLNTKTTMSCSIMLKNVEIASKCKNELNQLNFFGKALSISWYNKSKIYNSEKNNVFIKYIPLDVTPREVFVEFSKFGEIFSMKMKEIDHSYSHSGSGFISYENTDSVENAIKKANKTALFSKFPNSFISVEPFKSLHIRNLNDSNYIEKKEKITNVNCSVFVTVSNITTKEKDVNDLFSKIGEISEFKPNYNKEKTGLLSCIITYKNVNHALKAETELNDYMLNDSKLKVEKLNYYYDKNQNVGYSKVKKGFIIFIQNIPHEVDETFLKDHFSKFGAILNAIIHRNHSKVKVNNVEKEIVISLGKGTITFESQESANLAVESSNGKYLPGYETWKNPLFVDFFRSSNQRSDKNNNSGVYTDFNKMNLGGVGNFQYYGNNNFNNGINSNYNGFNNFGNQNYNNQQYKNNYNYGYVNQNDHYNPNQMNLVTQMNNLNINKQEHAFQELDMKAYNALLDNSSKLDFLGELIYSNISKHPHSFKMNISMEEIGKITGMLLGLENLDEIVAVCKSEKELTSRLEEGLQLIRKS